MDRDTEFHDNTDLLLWANFSCSFYYISEYVCKIFEISDYTSKGKMTDVEVVSIAYYIRFLAEW